MSDDAPVPTPVDPAWWSRYACALFQHRLDAVLTPSGLYHAELDRRWGALPATERTLVSQCRTIYVMAIGFEALRDTAYAAAVESGIAALRHAFQVAPGTYRWAVTPEGEPLSEERNAYGHAFVILALATAGRILQRQDWTEEALETWRRVDTSFRDAHGGLVWHADAAFRPAEAVRSQNPTMHFFEALRALLPAVASGTARAGAEGLWRFVLDRLEAPGRLPEYYDLDWNPLHAGPHAVVSLGHAFEWAFLASEADRLGVGQHPLDAGHAFLDFACRTATDPAGGGFFSTLHTEAPETVGEEKGWWEQTEALRALARYVHRHNRADLAETFRSGAAYARQRYVDPEFGGWYLLPVGPDPAEADPGAHKGSTWKLDYHVLNMALELAGTQTPTRPANDKDLSA